MSKIAVALVTLSGVLFSTSVYASKVSLYDYDLSFRINGVNIAPGDYQARWGLVVPDNLATPGSFSLLFGSIPNSANDGEFVSDGAAYHELFATLEQQNNSLIPAGAQLGLALSTLPYGADFSTSNLSNTVVFFDPAWIAPVFTSAETVVEYSLSNLTRVLYREPYENQTVLLSYAHNGGADIIQLTTIPEPSATVILSGLAVFGFCAARQGRRKSGRTEMAP